MFVHAHRFTKSIKIFLLLISAVASLTACDRKASESSKLSLVLPIQSNNKLEWALSGELAHLVVNVSGPGIEGGAIMKDWDACKDCAAPTPAPNPFVLENIVSSSDSRFVQVLAVYQDSTTGDMSFFYGDSQVVINQPDVGVTIGLDLINTTTNFQDGIIAGRYFDSAAGGPSGEVRIMYRPPGKPGMIIQRSQILNGWFSFFALNSVPFDYVLADGRALFQNVTTEDASFGASANLLHVITPDHDRGDTGSGTTTWKSENGSHGIYGWFGDATAIANKSVCYDLESNYNYTKMSVLETQGATKLVASDQAKDSSHIYFAGGLLSSNASCQVANGEFASFFTMKASGFDGNGKDGAMPFRVPMIRTGAFNSSFLSASTSGTVSTLAYKFLPGTVASEVGAGIGFDSISAFKILTTLENFAGKDGVVLCQEIASGMLPGFSRLGDFPITSASGSVALDIPSTERSFGVGVVLCPSVQGRFSHVGVSLSRWVFQGSGSGSNGGPVAGFQVNGPMSAFHMTGTSFSTGLCIPVMVTLQNATGAFTSTSSALSANFTLSGVTGVVYSDSSCSTSLGVSSTFSFAAGDYSKILYMNLSSGSTGTLSVNIPTVSASTNQFSFMLSGPITPTTPTTSRNSMIVMDGSCQEIPIYIGSPSTNFNFSSIGATAGIVSLTLYDSAYNPLTTGVGNTNGYFSTNCSSTTSISSVTIPANSFYTSVAYHTASPRRMDLFLRLTYDGINSAQDIAVNPSPYADHLTLSLATGGSLLQGICYPLTVTARDAANNPQVMGANPLPLTLSYGSGISVYHDASCNSPVTGGLNVPVAYSYVTYGVRFTQVNVGQISFYSNRVTNNSMAILDFTSTPIGWSPYNLSTSVLAWLTPEKINYAASDLSGWSPTGTAVSPSGFYFNAGGTHPVYSAGSMIFTGVPGQGLAATSIPSSTYTVAMLMKVNNPASSLNGLNLLSTDYERLVLNQTTSDFTPSWGGATAGTMTNSASPWRVFFITRTFVDATHISYQIDLNTGGSGGGTLFTSPNTFQANTSISYFTFGSPDAASSAMVEIREIIVMNGLTSEQNNIYNYFKAKYPTLSLP